MATCGRDDPTEDRGYPHSRLVAVQAIPAFDGSLEPFDIMHQVDIAANPNIWYAIATYTPGAGRRGFLEAFGLDFSNLYAWQEVDIAMTKGGPGPNGMLIGGGAQQFQLREGFCGILPHENTPFRLHVRPTEVITLSVRNREAARTFTAYGRLRGSSTCLGATDGSTF